MLMVSFREVVGQAGDSVETDENSNGMLLFSGSFVFPYEAA